MSIKCLFLFLLILVLVIGIDCVVGQTETVTQKSSIRDNKKKQSEAEKERQMRRALEIQNLVLSARTLPFEISADILFGVLNGTKLISDPKKRRELIEDIFRRASEAKEPNKRKQHEGLVDTRSGYSSMAYELDLDRLSIQLRAVKLMLAIDKPKARELFSEIPQIKLERLSCKDNLGYEISDFYNVLKDIVEQTFDVEAKRRREPIYFAASYIDTMDSPSQIGPVLDFLTSVKTTPQEFGILLDSFSTALRKISGDPRSFASSLKYANVTNGIRFGLLGKIREKGWQPNELLKTYRNYLTKHLSAVQCGDSVMTGIEEKPHPLIAFANTLFESPLNEDEIKPEKIEPGAKIFVYWKSSKAAKLLTNIKKLRFGNTMTALTSAERADQAWQQSLLKFLEQMDEWKPDDEETETDYLHQRCVLYDGLLDLTPSGAMRAVVLQDYALFLRDSNMQKESPVQWLQYVKFLLRTGKTLKGEEHAEFMNILSGAGNQVFPLYIDLDRLRSTAAPKS
ncbi:MAG: hypothetical protein ABIV48_04085 [Pyrinomonadaceae bacterium]